jgi:tetratricopeptide (TPR) repeat protein
MFFGLTLFWTSPQLLAAKYGTDYNLKLFPYSDSRQGSKRSVKDQSLTKAIKFLNQKQFIDAKREFETIWKQNPKQYKALLYLAEIESQNNNQKNALEYLETGSRLFPENPHFFIALGRYYFSLKNFEKSKNAYIRATELDKTLNTPHIDLGALYLQVFKKIDKAIEHLEKALLINSGHGGTHYALASAYGAKNNSELATQHFEIALNLNPDKAVQILDQMAKLYIRLEKLEEALVVYNRLIKKDPKNVKVHTLRGDVLVKLNDQGSAMNNYDLALSINPKYIPALLRKAMIHHDSGSFDIAELIYRSVIDINPKIAIVYNNLAQLLIKQQGSKKESLELAKKAVALMPGNPIFVETLKVVEGK